MTTVKLKFRESKIKGKEGTLYFQLVHRQICRQFSTAYRIHTNEWNQEKSTISTSSDDPNRSAYLQSVKSRVRFDTQRLHQIIYSYTINESIFSSDDVVNQFKQCSLGVTLFDHTSSIILKLKKLGRMRTAETYTATMRSVMRFSEGVDISLELIDADWVQSYENYLKDSGLIPNSTSFYMRILRAIYNRAVEEGVIEQRHPFKHVYTGVDKTIKRAIDIQYIKKIKYLDLSDKPSLQLARDLFLFSFYTRGMSFVDMAFLRKTNLQGGILIYRRRKTHQQIQLKWEECMQDIVNRYDTSQSPYLLPIITKTSVSERNQYRNALIICNKRLKKIGSMLGVISPLSMYVARHSWASAANSNNVPISVISQAMGHESEMTTKIYLTSLDNSIVDKANTLILELL